MEIPKVILTHGDCLEKLKDVPDNSVDLVLTDPPYGINYLSNKQCGDTREGKEVKVRPDKYFDKIKGDEEFCMEWIPVIHKKIKDGGCAYIFCHWSKWSKLEEVMKKYFKIKNMIVVNKSNHGMGDLKGSYAPKHELIMFASKGRHIFNQTDIGRGKDVFDGRVLFSGSHRHHPNEKPVGWLEPIIKRSCPLDGVVLDSFMGSGSTGMACKNLNRSFIGIEMDENYFKIAKERIEGNNFSS